MPSPAKLTQKDIETEAKYIGCEVAALLAVIAVETSGHGFDDKGRPIILFEPHVFWRNLPISKHAEASALGLAYPKWGEKPYPKGSDAQYDRLNAAANIDKEAAYRSVSVGLGQILGENHIAAGYPGAVEMFNGFSISEAYQLNGMAHFIVKNGLASYLISKEWALFAKHYNGAAYAKNQYDIKLAAAYAKAKAKPFVQAPSVVPQPKVVAPISVEIVKPAEPKKENNMLFPKISLSYLTGLYGAVVGALHLGSVIPATALPSLGMIGAGLAITAWKRNETRKAFQDAEKALMGQNLATALNNVIDHGVGALQDATGLTDASPTMQTIGGVVDSLLELKNHPSFGAAMAVVNSLTPTAPTPTVTIIQNPNQ